MCLALEGKHLMTLEVHECERVTFSENQRLSDTPLMRLLALGAKARPAPRWRWGSPFSVCKTSARSEVHLIAGLAVTGVGLEGKLFFRRK